ncbi:PASTA domain-containing protein, partial [Virgisporangium aurantiacum]|uniref:PASTA domain-containing protein n=1 Tax=Virgisporangium aurantiacum TaxID=175570 RepID=UPI00194FEB3B
VTGKTAAEAIDLLSKEGLTGTQQQAKDCQPADLNKVVKQTPAANSKVSEGSEVTFEVCLPPNKVTVPDLLGKSKADVEKTLAAAGLRWTYQQVDSAEPKDTVVSTSPGAGTAVDPNATITVNTSKFNQRKVPNLVGKSESEARQALALAGFSGDKLKVTLQDTNDQDEVKKVISQNPNANQVAFTNATITVVIGQKATQNPGPSNPPSSSASTGT